MNTKGFEGKNMQDFTLQQFRSLCTALISHDYTPITVRDYCTASDKKNGKTVILRHDVDRKLAMAVDMASIEYDMGITATYYFRHIPGVFDPKVIKKIELMGHEIGYHYEVLDKAKGDKKKAISIFEKELNTFRKYFTIQTICMHGNPLASWSNRDLWQYYDYKLFGIAGEPYLSIDYSDYFYISDTGRTWSGNFSIKDVVNSPFSESINHTQDIIRLVNEEKYPHFCLLIHPNRWTDSMPVWISELLWQNIKNVGKKIIKGHHD